MRKSIGIVNLILGILGIVSIFLAVIGIVIFLIYIFSVKSIPMYFIFESLNNPEYVDIVGIVMISFISFAISIIISIICSVAAIVLGALALGKKMSDKAVALSSIIFGVLGGGMIILILGIIFMVQLDKENTPNATPTISA